MSPDNLPHRLQASAERFVTIRRDIHAHPELGQATLDTSALVIRLLEEWGYQVHTGVGGHGVVGVLRRGQGGKTLGLRADMDALPIEEKTACPGPADTPG